MQSPVVGARPGEEGGRRNPPDIARQDGPSLDRLPVDPQGQPVTSHGPEPGSDVGHPAESLLQIVPDPEEGLGVPPHAGGHKEGLRGTTVETRPSEIHGAGNTRHGQGRTRQAAGEPEIPGVDAGGARREDPEGHPGARERPCDEPLRAVPARDDHGTGPLRQGLRHLFGSGGVGGGQVGSNLTQRSQFSCRRCRSRMDRVQDQRGEGHAPTVTLPGEFRF